MTCYASYGLCKEPCCVPAQQPAGPDVEAIRVRLSGERWGENQSRADIAALLAALEARDAEIADQRMVIAHQRDMRHAQQAEIRELRARLKEADGHTAQAALRALRAHAKLEKIRACVDGVTCQIPHLCAQAPQCLACLVRAILDR